MYAWILRTYYNVVVTDLRIVCLHPNNGFSALVIPVPLLSDCMAEFMTWRRNDPQSRIRLTGSRGSSDLTMMSDLRAGRQDKEGLRLPQMHADDLQQLRDDSVVESMMSTEWNRMQLGLVRSIHRHALHARTQMCKFLTSVNDLRGGSQDGGESFSQMVERLLEETLEVEEPVPKRHKALASTDFLDMSATMTQYMQTDFDMGSIPSRLHDMDTSEGSILQEVANFQR